MDQALINKAKLLTLDALPGTGSVTESQGPKVDWNLAHQGAFNLFTSLLFGDQAVYDLFLLLGFTPGKPIPSCLTVFGKPISYSLENTPPLVIPDISPMERRRAADAVVQKATLDAQRKAKVEAMKAQRKRLFDATLEKARRDRETSGAMLKTHQQSKEKLQSRLKELDGEEAARAKLREEKKTQMSQQMIEELDAKKAAIQAKFAAVNAAKDEVLAMTTEFDELKGSRIGTLEAAVDKMRKDDEETIAAEKHTLEMKLKVNENNEKQLARKAMEDIANMNNLNLNGPEEVNIDDMDEDLPPISPSDIPTSEELTKARNEIITMDAPITVASYEGINTMQTDADPSTSGSGPALSELVDAVVRTVKDRMDINGIQAANLARLLIPLLQQPSLLNRGSHIKTLVGCITNLQEKLQEEEQHGDRNRTASIISPSKTPRPTPPMSTQSSSSRTLIRRPRDGRPFYVDEERVSEDEDDLDQQRPTPNGDGNDGDAEDEDEDANQGKQM